MNIVVGCELFIEPTQFAELATWFQILEERRLRINHSDVDVAQTPPKSLLYTEAVRGAGYLRKIHRSSCIIFITMYFSYKSTISPRLHISVCVCVCACHEQVTTVKVLS